MAQSIYLSNTRYPWREVFLPWRIASHLYRQRGLIYQFTRRDVLGRYRGTYLGIFLSLLRPLFMLFVFTGVFGYIFGGSFGHRPNESRMDFALTLFCGLVPFNFAMECVSRAPTLVLSNPNYVTKVVFPLEILAISVVGAGLIHMAISLIPLFLGMLLVHGSIPLTVVYLPLILVPLVLLSLGVTWFLASLGVFIRDVDSIMPVVVMVLMYFSAIFYPISKVPPIILPFVQFNPMAVIVDQTRNVIMWGIPLDWVQYTATLLVSAVVMVGGYAFFMRTKRGFADVM
jgi:lipopolysaccharide transport system permease protein